MFLLKFCEAVYDLEFTEEPDYNLLRWYLEKNILDQNMAPQAQFDWIIKLK